MTNLNQSPVLALNLSSLVTENYKFFNTLDVVRSFEDQGYQLESTKFGKPKNAQKIGYQKHVMIFNRPELVGQDEKFRLLVTNSHDGSGSLVINVGIFRFVCSNGLVVGNSIFEQRVRHHGQNAMVKLNNAVTDTGKALPIVAEFVDKMKGTVMTLDDAREFARRALELRSSQVVLSGQRGDHNIGQVLSLRRNEDSNLDLFSVYNRVQENLIKGGITLNVIGNSGQDAVIKTRFVRGISRDIELNKGLWTLASEKIAA